MAGHILPTPPGSLHQLTPAPDAGHFFQQLTEDERNAILAQYLPDIQHYSYRFLKDWEAALEHAQDTIVTALECWHRYNPERCHPKAWLLTIAKFSALYKLRTTRYRKRLFPMVSSDRPINYKDGEKGIRTERDIHFADKRPSPEEASIDSDLLSRLKPALDNLPAEMREVLRLRFFEALTWQQIGARLGVNYLTARRRTNAAIKAIRNGEAKRSADTTVSNTTSTYLTPAAANSELTTKFGPGECRRDHSTKKETCIRTTAHLSTKKETCIRTTAHLAGMERVATTKNMRVFREKHARSCNYHSTTLLVGLRCDCRPGLITETADEKPTPVNSKRVPLHLLG